MKKENSLVKFMSYVILTLIVLTAIGVAISLRYFGGYMYSIGTVPMIAFMVATTSIVLSVIELIILTLNTYVTKIRKTADGTLYDFIIHFIFNLIYATCCYIFVYNRVQIIECFRTFRVEVIIFVIYMLYRLADRIQFMIFENAAFIWANADMIIIKIKRLALDVQKKILLNKLHKLDISEKILTYRQEKIAPLWKRVLVVEPKLPTNCNNIPEVGQITHLMSLVINPKITPDEFENIYKKIEVNVKKLEDMVK